MTPHPSDVDRRVRPDENRGPVVWCQGCRYERVQWSPFADKHLCEDCQAGAVQDPADVLVS